MKYKILLLLPAIVAAVVAGYLMNRTYEEGRAEEVGVTNGAAESEYNAAAGAYAIAVPDDIYYTEPVESVVFSHQSHAVDIQFKCSDCHEGLFQTQAGIVQSQPDFNMQGLAEGKYCGSCHTGTSGAAFASDTQCARCHLGVTGYEEQQEQSSDKEG